MKQRTDPSRFGIVVYAGVEPIDIGGTVGVISMARRMLPGIDSVTIAAEPGPVHLAGGLSIVAAAGFDDLSARAMSTSCAADRDGRRQVTDPAMLAFLRRLPAGIVASVCTGGLILAAAGPARRSLRATTRRKAAGAEASAPLARLAAFSTTTQPVEAAVADDRGVVTSGGVSLAIDGTLYLIGRLYGSDARDEVARLIEYDRAFAANRAALGHVVR